MAAPPPPLLFSPLSKKQNTQHQTNHTPDNHACCRSRPLNTYLRKRAARGGVNLLGGKNASEVEPPPEDGAGEEGNVTAPIISYLKPNMSIVMVDDYRCVGEIGRAHV